MKKYDAIVIGGGLLGCFAARELCRYDMRVALLEKSEDVCTGISKANSAIIYPGYDNKPGSLKARLTVRANADFDRLCRELQVPFTCCGSLMVSGGERADAVLRKKLANGLESGVPGLRIISGAEARELECGLSENISTALYAPSAGTVDPWQLCYAAFENAVQNGCDYYPNTELLSIRKDGSGYVLATDSGDFFSAAVVNCAGLSADRVHEMLFEPDVRIFADAADYMVFEGDSVLSHIIQHESETGEKGITAVPTVEGNILLELSQRPCGNAPTATDRDQLIRGRERAEEIIPTLKESELIRCFAAVRPNPHRVVFRNGQLVPDGRSIGSFVIENPEPGFVSFIGIKTPGLTCANELGKLAADKLADYLNVKKRSDFVPERSIIINNKHNFAGSTELARLDREYADIVCHCRSISRAQVREAVRRGAVTVDGVKRRCGAGLGICQGSRCQRIIAEIIAEETGISVDTVTKCGGKSYITGGCHE